MKSIFLKFAFMSLVFLWSNSVFAQTEAESAALVVESQQGDHRHEIGVGERVNYQVKGGKMVKKGKLEAIQDSAIVVAGKDVSLKDLEILVHRKGKRKPAGVGLTVGGLIAEPISFLLWIVSLLFLLDNPSAAQRVIIGILTAFTLFIFPLVIIFGLILMATGSKRFDLRKGWKARIAPKSEKG